MLVLLVITIVAAFLTLPFLGAGGIIPGLINLVWAFMVIHGRHADQRTQKIVDAVEKS